jgi:archaellum biogenesis ATPase FlaH
VLRVQIADKAGVSNSDTEEALSRVQGLSVEPKNLDWLVEKTEAFCRDRALYNAIMKSITIIDGKDQKHNREAIPSILQEALGISFNTAVGHSYLDNASERFDFYTRVESKIVLDIEMFNKITNGGLSRKTLNILLAQSGGGKSLVMSHMAAGCLRDGLNVLYISMEMSEEKIAERIDANLLDVEVDKIKDLGKDIFCTKISNLAAKTHGRLFIKEYPSGTAHTGHFRGLLEELKTKQDFVPDIIFVDYLGICASSRVKMGGSVNSYAYLKSVAEELRAFATENDVPIVTAGQVNRGGYNTSDLDMTDISESLGIVMTADIILGIVRTEELDDMGQVMFVQMKNRYSDPTVNKRFTVGLNRAKMKLYDLEGMANSSFTSDAANKTYASKLAQKPQEETLVSEDVIESLPIAGIKPKTINTDGFSF